MLFSINFNDTFRSAGWKEGAKKNFEFPKVYLFTENYVFGYNLEQCYLRYCSSLQPSV